MSPRALRIPILAIALALAISAPALAAGDFRFPAPQQRTLGNGLRIVVFPRPGSGVVQVQLRLAAGVSSERDEESGVANLTAQMLDQGTTSRSPRVFARDLDRVGGSLAAGAQRENASVAAAYLPADVENGLELLSDAVINPVFDEGRFGSIRNQSGRALLQLHADPAAVAEEQIWLGALPGVAAARPVAGSLAGLLAATRETARTFYRDHYRPNRAVLAIAGDITADRAFALAEQWFARWSGTSAAPAAAGAPRGAAETRIRLVDRPTMAAAEVRLGWRTPGSGAGDDLDRVAGARLLQESLARALKGRAPGRVDVALNEVSEGGFLEAGFTAPVDSVPAAISRVRRAMRDAMASVPDTTLAALRRQIVATYPLRFETLGGLLSQWLNADLVSSDAARLLVEYPGKAEALTPASVSKALARELDLEHPAIAVVGPAARLRAPLAKLGTVEVVPLDQPPATAAIADRDTLKTPTADDERVGREWAAKAIAAHGGLDRLRGIRSTILECDVTLDLEGRTLRGQMRQLRKEPYRMVFLTSFESFETRQVLDGSRAWSLAPGGQLQDADSAGVRALRTGFTSDVPHLLVSLADPAAKVISRGTARLSDREVRVLEVTLGSERRRVYLNPDNSQIVGMDQNEESGKGSRLMARRLYRDLRTVDGVLIPYEEERQLEGRTVMKLTVTKAEVNGEIADTEFQRPASSTTAPGSKN
jgi:zinc protease